MSATTMTRRCHYGTVGCPDTSDRSHECPPAPVPSETRCGNCHRHAGLVGGVCHSCWREIEASARNGARGGWA